MSLKLVIGNRNYSSWSFRGWLYLKESKISFEEIYLPLFTENWLEDIQKYSPAKRVPVLIDGDLVVWDTLAIFEYLLEKYNHAIGWPEQIADRAEARSITAEMHSGFLAVREELPVNIRAQPKNRWPDLTKEAQNQVGRICEIWESCYKRNNRQGKWLFGPMSIADIMYAPVALRFLTYGIPVPPLANNFIQAILELESVQEWIDSAKKEEESLDFIDNLFSAADSPLNLG